MGKKTSIFPIHTGWQIQFLSGKNSGKQAKTLVKHWHDTENVAHVLGRFLAVCITVFILFLLNGCAAATFTFTRDDLSYEHLDHSRRTYIGTRVDAALLSLPFRKETYEGNVSGAGSGFIYLIFLYPFILVDLPLSVLLDTLFLPYTIPHDARLRRAKQEQH